jgi:hypothetical protein
MDQATNSETIINMNSADQNKVSDFLKRKQSQCQARLEKVKKKRNIIKTVHYTTVVLSIGVTAMILCFLTVLPTLAIGCLAFTATVLMSLSAKLNLESKQIEASNLITKLNNLENQMEIILCNEKEISLDEFKILLKDFQN